MKKAQQVVFALSPPDEETSVRTLILGVTREAWVYMKDGDSHNFDFIKAGLPFRVIMFGGKDHQAVMRAITAGKMMGAPYKDARDEDFSIEPKLTDEEALRELAKASIVRGLLEQVQNWFNGTGDPEQRATLRARIDALLVPEEPTKE